jgi:RNA polymerase sigma factor (sigma-70 family)
MSAEKSAEEPVDLDALVGLALRMARRIARRRGMTHLGDELCSVAIEALGRALVAHDRPTGPIKPFAVVWIWREVNKAVAEEQQHAAREPLYDVAAYPGLRADEIAGDVADALIDLYADEELRSNGEAGFLAREAYAALRRTIEQLDHDDRTLVDLRYWQARTWEAIGDHFGITEKAARKRDERIREQLREALLAWDRVVPLRRSS